MLKINHLIYILLLSQLTACAAIQGAHGDAEMAKQIAATQAATGGAGTEVNTSTVPSPTPPKSVEQKATTNAAQLIAPLH